MFAKIKVLLDISFGFSQIPVHVFDVYRDLTFYAL